MTKEETDSVVKDFIELTARHTLALFNTLGLKTHIESMVIDDTTKEEYVFKFLKIGTGYKSKTDELAQKCLDQEKELASLRSELAEKEKLMGIGNPWPLVDVLKKLIDASEILLIKKSYDGHDYEEIEICVKRAKEIVDQLKNTKP